MSKPKRYLVFLFPAYYPGGGWSDLAESFDTEAEAVAYANASRYENREVVDIETGEDVYRYDKDS